MLTILFERPPHPDALPLLEGFSLITPAPKISAADFDLRGIQAVVVTNVPQIDRDFLARAPDLRVVGRPGIGVDNVNLADCTAAGVLVVNTPDAPSQSTAEHTVGLLFAVARKLNQADQSLRTLGWAGRDPWLGIELQGKTLGVIGLGRIGGRVAQIMRAVGMRVVAYDPYVGAARFTALGVEEAPTLGDVLRQADILTIHCPMGVETRRMIDAAAIARMKPGALLINCGRGPIVDEAALVDALQSGRLAGAGLDVFDPEPTLPGNPLFDLPNVLVTPHIASYTDEGMRKMGVGIVEEVTTALRGERPRWPVNPEVWERRRGS